MARGYWREGFGSDDRVGIRAAEAERIDADDRCFIVRQRPSDGRRRQAKSCEVDVRVWRGKMRQTRQRA